ncbi:MAG: hypothetical protein LBG50_00395 [Clostridiales Family XIII bacterium]|jgi:hypothetical protein|nr:hypothetical protein [Clostridiales Family XIII bacterium]
MSKEFYSYIIAGVGIIIVMFFAMKLRDSIRRDQEKKQRRARYARGPALARSRYKVAK